VILTWSVPRETNDGAAFRHRGPTKVCRAIDQFELNRCPVIATLETPTNQKTASFTDDLPADRSGPNDYATYAVEIENDRGRSAGLSNQLQIPTAALSQVHGTPAAQLIPDAVIVTANITEQNPAVPQTIELRRKEKGESKESTVAYRPLEVLTPSESANIELRDETFVWEKQYEYRAVVVGTGRLPNQSSVAFDGSISPVIEITTHDVFPPAVPTGVQAVFSGALAGQPPSVDLTWNPNSDRDLAGYFIYRRRGEEPAYAAVKLNAPPIGAPAYRDTGVEGGNTYLYSVSAVDDRGNESKRSEEASEKVPK
jgi:hypothetical protein